MSEPPPPTTSKPEPDKEFLLALYKDQGDELRSRSQAEHLYTAAALGAFGAVSWGVAGLPGKSCASAIAGLVAAAGVFFVAETVIKKITGDHGNYALAKKARADISKRLTGLVNCADLIPEGAQDANTGPGYLDSIKIVHVSRWAAIAFCVAIAILKAIAG